MKYYGKLFRPPSEARSLILQATVGCANNRCTFCSMYKEDSFWVRPLGDVLEDLAGAASRYPQTKRLFIADGDALVLPTAHWIKLLSQAKSYFPDLDRVSAYATAQDILNKSQEDLAALQKMGLKLLYLGFESGDDGVLQAVDKGVTTQEYLEASQRVKEAGIQVSATLIAGLAGSGQADASGRAAAKLITATKPDYLSYLSLMLEPGTPLYEAAEKGTFEPASPAHCLLEIKTALATVDSEGTVFRSNHPSNYLDLRGVLNEDRERLIKEIDEALAQESFRPEAYRGL